MLIDNPKERGILVVDDERGPREALRFLLKTRQYSNLHFAEDGVDALTLVNGLGPPVYLVLLDMRMPVMDGMTFLQRLAAQENVCPLGIIAVTGYPTSVGRRAFLDAGTDRVRTFDYLGKPFEMDDLCNCVARSLDAIHRLRAGAV